MFVDLTLEQALERLPDAALAFEERIVPALEPPGSHFPYLAEYSWMFHVERRVVRRLREHVGEYRQHLIGPGGLLSEVLSNAYCHAHRRNRSLPITVKAFTGTHGVLIRVEDTGPGFDVRGVVGRHATGRRYFQVAGSGIDRMATSEVFEVFYDEDGRAANLLRVGAPP